MDVLMPQLGETVAEGTVAAWHKAVGDEIRKDEILLDVETDKAAIEVPAPIAGIIAEIRVPEGETVDVGAVLAVVLLIKKKQSSESPEAREARKAQKRQEMKPIIGDAQLCKQVWENIDGLGNMYVWQCLLSF